MKSGQQLPPDKMNIDVHCHLFNKKMASVRLLFYVVKDILEKKQTIGNKSTSAPLDWVSILRIGCLVKMLFSKDNDTLLNYISKYEPDTVFVPLMFDLEFAVESDEAVEMLRQMKIKLQDELKHSSNILLRFIGGVSNFENLFNEVDDLIHEKEKAGGSTYDTFDEQYKQLVDIRNRYPSVIRPFFAVDPRRDGVYEKMKYALEKEGFAGIKMYCPNGYSPLDPRLDSVYQYCLEKNIPITAHCSYGGFATLENKVYVKGAIYKDNKVQEYDGDLAFTKTIIQLGGVEERALTLNHPDLWNVVLNKYKGLKLNLAHMGVRGVDDPDEKYEWSKLIAEMMLEHENLYTDFSCVKEKEIISYLWELATNADQKCGFALNVTDRIMFGTDFWLNMLFTDMKSYMKNFESAFAGSQQDLIRLRQLNPKRFLS